MARSAATRFVSQTVQTIAAFDFDPATAAYLLSGTAVNCQRLLGDLMLNLLNQWAAQAPTSTPDNPLHTLVTQSAVMMQALDRMHR